LEREAGAALLDRTARSARLTDTGRRLAMHAARILAAVEAAENDIAARAATPAGRVVLAAFPAAAVAFAPALTRELDAFPDLALIVRQGPADCDLNQLRSGDVDIILSVDWTAAPPDDAVTRVRLYRDALVLAVAPTHRLADPAEPLDAATLRTQTWIGLPAPDPTRHALTRLLGGNPARTIRWEFEGLATIVSLVAHGAGIALVPHIALIGDRHQITVRELPPPPPTFDVHAVVRPSGLRNPAIAATVAALRKAAAEIHNPVR
jgi:DNA-binding transcriptional LysR family regulator